MALKVFLVGKLPVHYILLFHDNHELITLQVPAQKQIDFNPQIWKEA